MDGNSRMAIALLKVLLLKKGYDFTWPENQDFKSSFGVSYHISKLGEMAEMFVSKIIIPCVSGGKASSKASKV